MSLQHWRTEPEGVEGRACRIHRGRTPVRALPGGGTGDTFTVMRKVKERPRGTTRVSSKHQVTIPADALRAAGLRAGERLVARADGPGRVVFEREQDALAAFSGALTGAYEPDELARLRDEWD